MKYIVTAACAICNEQFNVQGISASGDEMVIKIAPECACNRNYARLKTLFTRMVQDDKALKEMFK